MATARARDGRTVTSMNTKTTAKTTALGPKTAPDEVAITRLRRVLAVHLGEIPQLDAHLALLDSRGVLYAAHAAENWSDLTASTFFGLVRHVIRTQCEGPVPDPDVEGWLAAGRPADRDLGDAWDLLNLARYTADPPAPTPRPAGVAPAIEQFDSMLRSWPAHMSTFAGTYCRLEWFIERNAIAIPPILV